ncbi:2-acylglycerol O-acyltransferase 1-like isoform X2 [Paramacrobiotus metropolitanus]|nr:2-acylglycerol O-acyltransferase 1-like isoform X2 [Paramacrobiotus metropolitanus]
MRFTQLSTRLAYIHPIFRDFLMLLGIANASEENIRYMANKGTGNAMVLVIGGAAETLDARPGMHRLVLKDRKGFVRTALKTGCHLIPVYGFGENDIYDQVFNNPVGSRWRKVQRWVQAKTGVPVLVYVYGSLKIPFWYPYRRPINIVVGKPIPVPHISHPTEQQIDKLHQQYKKALRDLFDTHKGLYGHACSEIEFI